MTRPIIFVLLAALATAIVSCGPVPHPFRGRATSNPLVDDRRVTSSVRVMPIAAFPGLDAEVVRELAHQDVLAFTHDTGPRTVSVNGAIENGNLVWRLTTADRHELGVVAQAIPPAADNLVLAREAAPLIVQLLTSDASLPDTSNRAHVAVHLVHGPEGIDARSLTQAMADALARQGILVADTQPVAVVDGEMRVLPGSGGQDVLQVDWTIHDAKGAPLGTVSQGSPVDRTLLSGPMTGLVQDIAAAAAPGVLDVIRHKAPAALETH